MEVKIGVKHSPREVVLESTQTQDEIEKLVSDVLTTREGVLALSDERGRRVIVAADLISYVEIAQADSRRVGFTAG